MNTHNVSMRCVHTHQGISTINGWGSWIVFEMMWKKLGKIIEMLGKLVQL
jgi:hypothetical protein